MAPHARSLLLLVAVLLTAITQTVSAAGVTFSAEFEKGLGEKIAILQQEIKVYPKLQTKVDGYPMSVPAWAALNRSEIKTTLKAMQKIDVVDLIRAEPARAVEISQFKIDIGRLATFFINAIDDSTFTVAPPKTSPPETTRRPSSTGASPREDDGSGSSAPVTRPSYSLPTPVPLPVLATPAPYLGPEIRIKTSGFWLTPWQLILFIVVGLIVLFRTLFWFLKRQAKLKKQREEEQAQAAAATAASGAGAAELGQAEFAAMPEQKQSKVV